MRLRNIVIIVLVMTNLATGVVLVRSWSQHWMLRMDAEAMATYAGSGQATIYFYNDLRRVYELYPSESLGDTGRRDGPFEVWTWPSFPSLGEDHVAMERRFVDAYNRRIRNMCAHPEKFALHLDTRGITTRPSTLPTVSDGSRQ